MTPEERQMLTALADRIKSSPAHDRDAEADQFIGQLVHDRPDTTYLLAQTVLMQDFALRNAQSQITDLQRQLQEAASRPAAPARGGSFLSGLFGSGQPQSAPPSSVPPVNPWGRAAAPAPAYAPEAYAQPQPGYAQPGYAPVVMQPSQTSGFLRQAATTAAGVAGGALLFEGIQSLFSGHQGFGGGYGGGYGGGGFFDQGGFGGGIGPRESISETTIINNNYDTPQPGGGTDSASRDYQPGADYAQGTDSDYQGDSGYTPDSGYQDVADTSGSDYSSDDYSGGGDDSSYT
jgi:hypothetical protein